MGSWISKQLEATTSHLVLLIISAFLILYAFVSSWIRNRLFLSEPPIFTLIGIIFGPRCLDIINPIRWQWTDSITQETSRVIASLTCFSVGLTLPKAYFRRHWKSVGMMLGPVMAFSWLVTAGFIYGILKTKWTTALIISACLAPTDPVLSAAVLQGSKFSDRVPRRLRHLLSAESGCNDGTSFPFLYISLNILMESTAGATIREWFLTTILWQCTLGLLIGITIGLLSNRFLRLVEYRQYIAAPSFLSFYLLLALFSAGIASTLGVDDFLVAFGAGVGLSFDGWFANKTKSTHLPEVLDLLLNSSMFVYFGAIIPWHAFSASPHVTVWQLVLLLFLIFLFRRIPVVLALKPLIPDLKTYREALFCGHFGPMGIGAMFLAIEARAQLETGRSMPLPEPPKHHPNSKAIELVWIVVSFVILGSTMVHGCSVAFISVTGHFMRKEGERAPLLAGEEDGLEAMVHEREGDESEASVSGDEDPDPPP